MRLWALDLIAGFIWGHVRVLIRAWWAMLERLQEIPPDSTSSEAGCDSSRFLTTSPKRGRRVFSCPAEARWRGPPGAGEELAARFVLDSGLLNI
jgi:hypothetical protein